MLREANVKATLGQPQPFCWVKVWCQHWLSRIRANSGYQTFCQLDKFCWSGFGTQLVEHVGYQTLCQLKLHPVN